MTNSVPNKSIQDISFLGSFPKVAIAPQSKLPEFAFIGRSNVGKSSLINYICNRKKLAKTSGTPGKTQMINLFEINNQWILADLPGYGYARTSKKTRAKWTIMIEHYLLQRPNLATAFILIDSRLTPQESDLTQIKWLGSEGIPFSIVFTKSDKLKPDELTKNVDLFLSTLRTSFASLPNHFITSATGKKGGKALFEYIAFVCAHYE